NSVALGAGSVATRPNTVSVGGPTRNRQVTNLAPGTEGTDAVDLNQMNSVGAVSAASMGALAAAAGERGNNRVAVGAGEYGGQAGLGLAYQRAFEKDWTANAAMATDGTGADTQMSAGVGYSW
ncbi:MAG: YadA-like family protein, partial [bacterium]